MIIMCEACSTYEDCPLDKRRGNNYMADCIAYRQTTEEFTRHQVEEIVGRAILWKIGLNKQLPEVFSLEEVKETIDEGLRSVPIRPIVRVNIPMRLTEKDLLDGEVDRSLYENFLRLDLPDKPDSTLDPFFTPEGLLPVVYLCFQMFADAHKDDSIRHREMDELFRDLKAVQEDLQQIVDRWKGSPSDFGMEEIPLDLGDRQDIVAEVYRDALKQREDLLGEETGTDRQTDVFRLNAWFRKHLEFSVERNDKGVIKSYPRVVAQRWYCILYYLFFLDVIEKQIWKLCPAGREGCEVFVDSNRGSRKGKGACRNEACQKFLDRHPELAQGQ